MKNKINKMNKLENWFCPTDKIFKIFKKNCLDYHDKNRRRIFMDNDSKVLLVVHADTVRHPRIYKQMGTHIWATGLDDRLGCWIAYRLSIEFKIDLLITDLEESALTTALYHDCKKYNWVAEFDRNGEDVVLYECGSEKFKKALKEFWTIGWGTFSDISMLETDATCVNVGIGYNSEHSEHSWADLAITAQQENRFKQFYKKYKDKAFIRDYKPSGCNSYGGYGYRYYQSNLHYLEGGKWFKCDCCEQTSLANNAAAIEVDDETWYVCSQCSDDELFVECKIEYVDDNKDEEELKLIEDELNNQLTIKGFCIYCKNYIGEEAEYCEFCHNFIEQIDEPSVYNREDDVMPSTNYTEKDRQKP